MTTGSTVADLGDSKRRSVRSPLLRVVRESVEEPSSRSRRWRRERYQLWQCERAIQRSGAPADDFHPMGRTRLGRAAPQEAMSWSRGWSWSVNDQTTSSMKGDGVKRHHHLAPCTEFLPFDLAPSCPRPRAFLRCAPETLQEKVRAFPARNQLGRRAQRARSAAWIHSAPFALLRLAGNTVPKFGAIIPFFGMFRGLILHP